MKLQFKTHTPPHQAVDSVDDVFLRQRRSTGIRSTIDPERVAPATRLLHLARLREDADFRKENCRSGWRVTLPRPEAGRGSLSRGIHLPELADRSGPAGDRF
jgi:hypothetical protein